MVTSERTVIWIPSGEPGWELEAARPYEPRSVGGGLRSLYEIAAALAVAGRDVELRGVVASAVFDEVCAAAGARPCLPGEPRAPEATDTVIVPEGIADPAVHARLALSPARVVLMMLGPPGLVGWPFVPGWSAPDPLTVDITAVARQEHFRGAAALGYELWTHTIGLQRAAEAAGVPCRWIGNGVPGGYPDPPRKKDLDVVWLRGNRWAPLARPTIRRLGELGVDCVALPAVGHREVLELFGRARILLHPLRVEGHSRIGCEARAMGAVPLVLASNPFAVGLDELGGAVAVDEPSELAGAVLDLLGEPARLARLSAAGVRTAREQVEWEPFVERVAGALDAGSLRDRSPQAEIGRALRAQADAAAGELAQVAELRAELERHRAWLEATNGSISWRATAPLRAARRAPVRSALSAPLRSALRALPRPAPSRAPEERPAGRIDWPPEGTELERAPVDLHGWCLFPGSSVARVEVSLNGGTPAKARIALEWPSSAPDGAHPDAPICGFEHKPDLSELPANEPGVRVQAVAYALDGRELALDPVTYRLETATPEARLAEPAARGRRPHVVRAGGGLRLLAFTHTLGYGGASLYLLELLRRLRRSHGVECEVASVADGPLRALLEDEAIPVHMTDPNAAGTAVRYESHIAELVGWGARRNFDAVLVNTLGAFAGADLAERLGLPAVWVVHESFPLPMFWFNAFPPPLLDPHVQARAEAALRSSSAVLFVADATRELFVGDADPERLVTLPYGVELEEIDAARRRLDRAATRRRLGVPEDARLVLCLGTIEPRKSQAMLAQAFAQVAGRRPDARLALVGATEDAYCAAYRGALHEYVARMGLGDRVRIEPVTQDPWSWHAAADLLVCASDIESLPRSITEAMAFGTPVLSTRVFGVPELIDDGVNGFLCEMRDVASLAGGLDSVLGMGDGALAAVARAAGERVRARHDPDRYAAALMRLLQGLAADPDALPRDLLASGADAPAAAAP